MNTFVTKAKCLLLALLFHQVATAQEPTLTPTALPFPLPTRAERLAEEARQPPVQKESGPVSSTPAERDARLESLRAVDQRDERYSQTLLKLAEAKDKRVLKIVEEYLALLPFGPHDPLTENQQIQADRGRLQVLYWRLKLEGTSLQQKVMAFRKWGTDVEKSRNARRESDLVPEARIGGLDSVLAESGPAVVPFIERILVDKKTPTYLKQISAWILDGIKTPQSTAALHRALASSATQADEDSVIRTVLMRRGDARAVTEKLQETLQVLARGAGAETLNNWKVVTPALHQVERLASVGVDKQKLEIAILPYLEQGSSTAVMAARSVGGARSIEPLIAITKNPQAAENSQRQTVRNSAITTLGIIGHAVPEKVLPFLIGVAYSTEPMTRTAAVQALARVGDRAVIPVLLDLAKKEMDSTALRFEISGIYRAGGSSAVKALEELKQLAQEKSNAWMQELAEEGLLRLSQEKRTEETAR